MTELINKEELLRRFKPFGREIPKDIVIGIIASMKEEIVRCKECMHYDEGLCWHPAAEAGDTLHTEPTDFCRYGERSEDN